MALVTKNFSDIITFTRASTGTFFNSAGVLTSAAINAPRFDYNPATLAARGLLIEEQRTNSLTYSEAFDTTPNWGVVRSTITANAVVAPDGNTTADKLVEDSTAANSHYVTQNVVHTGAQTLSLFAKKAEIEGIILWGIGATSYAAGFNLNTGTTYAEAISGVIPPDISTSIVNVGNGWFRCSISFTASSGTSIRLLLDKNANGTGISNGDGTSGVYIWGAQLEAGAFPTSYIPTTTTALTRSADVASVNTLSPWYNATEGTLFADVALAGLSATANQNAMQFSDGTTSNRIALYRQSSALGTALSFGATINGGAWATTATRKLALGNQSGNSALAENGTITGTGTGTTAQTVNQLRLGSNHDGTGGFTNGWLRRITYYPRRLSNAELQSLTV